MSKNKITPFLWYDSQAEEAANFYVSVFKNSKILNVNRTGPDGPAFTVQFELDGQFFTALNAGPMFKFTEAFSVYVDCEDQKEVDEYWNKFISNGGEESMCGWLKDKWGLSWQIIPKALQQMLSDPDREKADRAMQAMLQMHKIDIQTMKNAFDGK